jgi:hypothetical protein
MNSSFTSFIDKRRQQAHSRDTSNHFLSKIGCRVDSGKRTLVQSRLGNTLFFRPLLQLEDLTALWAARKLAQANGHPDNLVGVDGEPCIHETVR